MYPSLAKYYPRVCINYLYEEYYSGHSSYAETCLATIMGLTAIFPIEKKHRKFHSNLMVDVLNSRCRYIVLNYIHRVTYVFKNVS